MPATFKSLLQRFKAALKLPGTNVRYLRSAAAMQACGSVVSITDPVRGVDCGYIETPIFDNITLLMCVVSYNNSRGTNYSLAEMKELFFSQDEIMDDYADWYTSGGDAQAAALLNDVSKELGDDLNNMKIDELEKYMNGR